MKAQYKGISSIYHVVMGRPSLVKRKRGGVGGECLMPSKCFFPQYHLSPCSTPVALNITCLVWGSTTLPIGWSIRSTYEEQMWAFHSAMERPDCYPISATALATPSLLIWAWQQPPSQKTQWGSWLSGCSFTIFSPHWRIVITKQHPRLFKRWFWKIPPTYYLTL